MVVEYVKSVGSVIFRRNKEVMYLVLQYGLGHWDFVKGIEEKGEKEKATAARETVEETGIKDLIFVEGFRERISYFYRWEGKLVSKSVVFYLAETKKKRVKLSSEHTDFKWLTFPEATKQITFDNSRKILEKADMFLKRKIA